MLLNFCCIGTGLEFQEIFKQLSFQLLLVISLQQLRHDEWLFKKVMASHNGRKKEIIHPQNTLIRTLLTDTHRCTTDATIFFYNYQQVNIIPAIRIFGWLFLRELQQKAIEKHFYNYNITFV